MLHPWPGTHVPAGRLGQPRAPAGEFLCLVVTLPRNCLQDTFTKPHVTWSRTELHVHTAKSGFKSDFWYLDPSALFRLHTHARVHTPWLKQKNNQMAALMGPFSSACRFEQLTIYYPLLLCGPLTCTDKPSISEIEGQALAWQGPQSRCNRPAVGCRERA